MVGFAFSPIDIIPDFIPVLGYLDDLVVTTPGVALAVRMIPAEVLSENRHRVRERGERPVSRAAAAVIVALWLALAVLAVCVAVRLVWS